MAVFGKSGPKLVQIDSQKVRKSRFSRFWPLLAILAKKCLFWGFPDLPLTGAKIRPGGENPGFSRGAKFPEFSRNFPGGKIRVFWPSGGGSGRGPPRAGTGPGPRSGARPRAVPRDRVDPDWESLRSEGGASGMVGARAPGMSRTSRLRLRARARPHRRHRVRAASSRQTLTELSVIVYDR